MSIDTAGNPDYVVPAYCGTCGGPTNTAGQCAKQSCARESPLALACGGCGGPHRYDTSVPSVVWNAVVRARGMSEYLCASCVIKAFVQAGESFTAQLWGDDLPPGVEIEVRVRGAAAKDAARISEENTALRVELAAARERERVLREAVADVVAVGLEAIPTASSLARLAVALRATSEEPKPVLPHTYTINPNTGWDNDY